MGAAATAGELPAAQGDQGPVGRRRERCGCRRSTARAPWVGSQGEKARSPRRRANSATRRGAGPRRPSLHVGDERPRRTCGTRDGSCRRQLARESRVRAAPPGRRRSPAAARSEPPAAGVGAPGRRAACPTGAAAGAPDARSSGRWPTRSARRRARLDPVGDHRRRGRPRPTGWGTEETRGSGGKPGSRRYPVPRPAA